MAIFKPFKAVRPTHQHASKVAALPYDVMNSEEAREMVKDNPHSFLHVDKAEIDLDPSVDIYDDKVYKQARHNLDKMQTDGVLVQDKTPNFYIYKLTMDGMSQTGLVGSASIDDYLNNIIKKHEFTRADKEADRIRHVDELDANTGPIFLTRRPMAELDNLIENWAKTHTPAEDFTADDGVRHEVWTVDDANTVAKIEKLYADVDYLYIADGHHRNASAVKVGQKRREANPNYTGDEEFNYYLSVVFPADQLRIMDYNRVVKDLSGNTPDQFIDKIKKAGFEVEPLSAKEPSQAKPTARHTFSMYLDGQWYKLTAHPDVYDENDPVSRLDVSIMQNNILNPILGIQDPRTDKRIDFVGGIRGLGELTRLVDSGKMKVAFAMHPTSLDDLMAIADAGMVMPPKSTWFEPKLRSGLFIHKLS